MKNYLLILPVAMLVSYSQIVVKWRSGAIDQMESATLLQRIFHFVSDPIILSAYTAALIASFAWLYVVTKLPLTTAFPVYIGVTFVMVLFGGWIVLAEAITTTKLLAVLLIVAGITLGVSADA